MGKKQILHNKLVRDNIPEYLEGKDVEAEIEVVMDKVRHLRLLIDKLEEEAHEVALADEGHILEELGDVETVVDGILERIGKTRDDLKKQQRTKDEERGALYKGIFLIRTLEEEK